MFPTKEENRQCIKIFVTQIFSDKVSVYVTDNVTTGSNTMFLQSQFPGSLLDKILTLAANFNYKRNKPLRLDTKGVGTLSISSQTRLTSGRFPLTMVKINTQALVFI